MWFGLLVWFRHEVCSTFAWLTCSLPCFASLGCKRFVCAALSVGWLVSCLVYWLIGWLAWLGGFFTSSVAEIAWPLNLRRSLACELTAHLIRAWLAFEPFWSNFFYRDFQLRGILLKKWSWARFFRRPLYQCDFEICSTTPQLDPNRKPIWFCNCKLRYTVWEI